MTTGTDSAKKEVRGTVLEVIRELLAGGRSDEAIGVVAKLVARNEELEALVAKMRDKNRRERVSSDQLDLFLNQLLGAMGGKLAEVDAKLNDAAEDNGGREKDKAAGSETKPAKQPPARRPPPPGLRRVDNPIPVPAAERSCPVCGADRTCIGHDTTEVIELIPAEVIVRLDRRELLACETCEAEVVRAPRGDKVVDGGIYGSYLVADLVVGKYWDSLPLHRQGQRLERLGLSMPSSSMADQIRWATELLEPVWLFLMKQVLLSTVMHVDATSLPVKDKDAVGGITLGSLWGYVGDESAAVYLYTRTGKKVGQVDGEIGPHDFLAMRTGFVVADAAGIFDESFRRPDLIEIGRQHARAPILREGTRGQRRARAAIPIKAFKTLYDVEDDVRGAQSERRFEERMRSVEAGLRRAHRLVQDVSTRGATELSARPRDGLPPEPSDGPDAIPRRRTVADRQRDRGASASSACSAEAQLPLCGLPHGAQRAAIAYSILSTCHLLGINPTEYLADVLPRLSRGIAIARDIPALTPAAWKAARDRLRTGHASPAA